MPTKKNPIAETTTRFINSTSRHIFLTGKAGTGKTTFLKNITRLTHKNTIVAAPTGIAAINAEGVTLHSLFQLPFGAFVPFNTELNEHLDFQVNTPQSIVKSIKMNKTKRNMLRELELLIIDEASMLRADLLDAIDVIMRSIRRQRNVAFGGVQVLFIGDLFQLQPIVKANERELLSEFYTDMFFFNAKVLENVPPLYIELEKIFRQSDPVFISLLNHLREDNLNQEDIERLNQYYQPGFRPEENDGYVFLTTHNVNADKINKEELNKLKTKSHFFTAQVEGDFGENFYPVEEQLELKKGAQVMFIKNDYSGERRYFNGKIGYVSQIDNDNITVSFKDETSATSVDRYIWENKRYTLNKETNEIEEKCIGTFTHYPLKPAWAVTIHKSQGLTFDKAVIDVSRAFAPGQIYVALSRLTSLDGLVLSAPIPVKGFLHNQSLLEFNQNKKNIEKLEIEFHQEARGYIIETVMKAFSFHSLLQLFGYHINSYNKDKKKSAKQQYKEWAVALLNDTRPIKQVADKFLNQLKYITANTESEYLPLLHKRLLAAKEYFEPLLRDISNRINGKIDDLTGQRGIKSFLNELRDLERLYFSQLQQIYKAEAIVDATLKNAYITRESLKKSGLYDGREKAVKRTNPKKIKSKAKSGSKEPKPTKQNTKEISFNLFNSGKNIAEIAKERGLVVSTIEGHLAHYIRQGSLDIYKVLDKSHVQEILAKTAELKDSQLNPLKNALENKYSYGELKMAVAYYQSTAKEKS